MMQRALFIFRRDLRLHDNRGLIAALKAANEVILSFIFTTEQIEKNSFKSARCLQFMIESLEDLEKEIGEHQGKLHLFYGEPEEIVRRCIEELDVKGVFINYDYTPYSLKRDQKIKTVCDHYSVVFQAEHDLLLHPIEETLKGDGKPYTVFTPFYRNACHLEVAQPEKNKHHRYYTPSIPFSKKSSIYHKILPKRVKQAPGGRRSALKILHHLPAFSAYGSERDVPYQDKTTHLSAHLKFTTVSIREVYHLIVRHLGPQAELLRSLYWRDFFTLIAFHFPYVFERSFKSQFQHLAWKKDPKTFDAWCQGITGFPLVDAGMRELHQTGFMHNRVRMITASFLIKDAHIDWQWGEKYFAQHLIDYDPAVNNGNWQWVASTGCDAQPYFRIFNPWLQAKKFDPNCHYIKKWIPELAAFSPTMIHAWHLQKYHSLCQDYPSPIVDHHHEAAITLRTFRQMMEAPHRNDCCSHYKEEFPLKTRFHKDGQGSQ